MLGLIATLFALSLPALRGAALASRRVACLSNLRSLHGATHMFVEENGGLLPLATSAVWVGAGDTAPLQYLAPYLELSIPEEQHEEVVGLAGPYVCPADRDYAIQTGCSYAYIPWVFMAIEGQASVSRRYAAYQRLVLFSDVGRWHPDDPVPLGSDHRASGRNAVTMEGKLGWNRELQAAALGSLR